MKLTTIFILISLALTACASPNPSPTPAPTISQPDNQSEIDFYRGVYRMCLEFNSQVATVEDSAIFCLAFAVRAREAKWYEQQAPGYQWPLPAVTNVPAQSSITRQNLKPLNQSTYTVYLPLVASSCSWAYIDWVWTQPVTYFLHQDVLNCYHLLYPFNPETGTYTDDNVNPAPPLCPPPAPNPWRDVFNSSNCQ